MFSYVCEIPVGMVGNGNSDSVSPAPRASHQNAASDSAIRAIQVIQELQEQRGCGENCFVGTKYSERSTEHPPRPKFRPTL